MGRLSSLWQEFKAFAFKGNMIDLAVAVVIGAAFSGVINSLVKDMIMPGVIYVVQTASTAAKEGAKLAQNGAAAVTGKPAETQPSTQPAEASAPPPAEAAKAELAPAAPPPPPAEKKDPTKAVELTWKLGPLNVGAFVSELVNFLLVAAAVFLVIVKLLGSVMKKVGGTPAPTEPTTKECPYCLSVIPIKAKKCAHCTSDVSVATNA